MRRFAIGLAFLLSATAARVCAQEAASDAAASSQLQNLVYYPHAGLFRLTGAFIPSLADSGSTDNAAGAATSSRSTSYDKASLALSYGIGGGLRLGVSETELFNQQVQTTNAAGAVTTTNANGLSDPTITLARRFKDAEDYGVSVDGVLSATPHLGTALGTGGGQTGNDLESGWNATASLPVYLREPIGALDNEFEFDPSLSRFFGGVTSGPAPKNSTLISSYWHGALDFLDRIHLTRAWYVEPEVSVNLPYSYDTANEVPTSKSASQSVDIGASPTLAVGYLATAWLLLEASFTYSDRPTSADPASGNATTADTTQSYATLRAEVQF